MPSAREHLERLAAAPRPAGSRAEADARAWCETTLRALGFTVSIEPFEYSTVPGRLATPLLGLALVFVLCGTGHVGWRGHAGLAVAVLIAGGAVVATSGAWLARHGTRRLPWGRRGSANVVAVRAGGGPPRLWLVAHLDSKSQPVPILARALGIAGLGLLWIVSLVLAAAQLIGAVPGLAHALWPWLAVAAVVAGAPVVSSGVGERSPGAVDNASGVAAVLRAGELAPAGAALGVLVTSAEELGLAGARAWAAGSTPSGTAVNVDSIDDRGRVRLMYTGRRAATQTLLARLGAAMPAARVGRLLPGILTDGVALRDAGWSVVTVARGTWRTLGRIHTPADDLRALSGGGVEQVALALAAVAAED